MNDAEAAARQAVHDKLFVTVPFADRLNMDRVRELRELATSSGRALVYAPDQPLQRALVERAADPNVRKILKADQRSFLASIADIAAGKAIAV
jgi:hypothetical protein